MPDAITAPLPADMTGLQRAAIFLLSLGEKEVHDIVEEQGLVTVTCDFCGAVYHYDRAQVQALFSAEQATQESPPRSGLH